MSQLTITAAEESDVPAILEMILELAEFEHLAPEVKTNAEMLRVALFKGQPVAWALMGRVNDVPAGYAIYYRTFSTFVGRPGIYLEDIYVRPQFRKCGLGRAMLEAVARASVDLGGGRLEWMALDWNENALRFYRGLGAKVLGDWRLLRMTGEEVRGLVAEGKAEG
jgi:GNAT superfamily N-acetyltransferase